MKTKFKFLLLAGLLGFSACTNELPDLNDSKVTTIQLVKSPEIYGYIGSQEIGTLTVMGNSGNNGDGATGNTTWDQFIIPENITETERVKVFQALEEKVTGEEITEDIVLPWENYFLQDVWSAVQTDTPSKSYEFEAYNKDAECNQKYWPAENFKNYSQVTNNGQISSYYQDRTTNPQTRIDKTALMTNMQNGTYDEMRGKQFRWFINCHENLHWSSYIFVKVDNSYYICFDFACGYPENDVDGNPGRGSTWHDWDYDDWIIKISPAIPVNDPEKEFPVLGEPEEDPKVDNPIQKTDHVEINLSIEERPEIEWLSTHLSIHVRAVTDVTVYIPLPIKYVCEADDLAIVNKHEENLMIHGGPQSVEYNINKQIVTLNINYSVEGITIFTEGITPQVIDYCYKNYGDGLTFEIWNYMNINHTDWYDGKVDEYIDTTELRRLLNNSSVIFTKKPSLYINAFMCNENGEKFIDDCTVSPEDIYLTQETNYWYNGSPYNELYY